MEYDVGWKKQVVRQAGDASRPGRDSLSLLGNSAESWLNAQCAVDLWDAAKDSTPGPESGPN